jgi:hypothetical protein
MSFTVDAAGLAGLPTQLDRLKQDALRGSGYVGDHATMSYGGVLNDITADHERIVHDVRGYLEKLAGPVAGNTGEAVRAALTYYGHADAKAAARLDATYPETRGGPDSYGSTSYSSGARRERFGDLAAPSSHYVAPRDHHVDYPDEPTALDQISASAVGRWMIIRATELAAKIGLGHRWDPYEEILKPVTGDWNGLRGCADVYANVGGAVGDMAVNLRAMADAVPEVWSGNAADGLTGYLLKVAGQLDDASRPFADLGTSYQRAAENAHEHFQQAGELLNDLIDLIALFIVEAAAAVATAETGVGPAILGAAAAVDAFEIYETIHTLFGPIAAVQVAIENLCSELDRSHAVDIQAKLPALDPAHLQLPGDQSGVGKITIGAGR